MFSFYALMNAIHVVESTDWLVGTMSRAVAAQGSSKAIKEFTEPWKKVVREAERGREDSSENYDRGWNALFADQGTINRS